MFKHTVLALVLFLVAFTNAFAFDQIETSWTNVKSYKTRDTFSLSYIAFPQGTTPETYQYRVYGANTTLYFKAVLTEPADITDFETSFKNNSTEVGSEEEAIANTKTPITKTGSLTTSSTTALQTVLTYTVPAKQTLHVEQWMVGRLNSGNAEISISQLQVNGTVFDGQTQSSNNTAAFAARDYAHPLPVANAGDVVTIKITPSATGSTMFSARIIGQLR